MSASQNGSETPDSENPTLQHDELPSKRIRRSSSDSSQSDSIESDSDDSIAEPKSPKTVADDMLDAINEFWYTYTNQLNPKNKATRAESLEMMNRAGKMDLDQLKRTNRLIEEQIKKNEDN